MDARFNLVKTFAFTARLSRLKRLRSRNFFADFGKGSLKKVRYLLLTSLESTSAILLQGASDVGESIVLFVDLPLLMQEDPFMLSLSCFFSYRWVSFSYFLMSERFLAQFLQHSLDYDKLFSSIYTSVYIK